MDKLPSRETTSSYCFKVGATRRCLNSRLRVTGKQSKDRGNGNPTTVSVRSEYTAGSALDARGTSAPQKRPRVAARFDTATGATSFLCADRSARVASDCQ